MVEYFYTNTKNKGVNTIFFTKFSDLFLKILILGFLPKCFITCIFIYIYNYLFNPNPIIKIYIKND